MFLDPIPHTALRLAHVILTIIQFQHINTRLVGWYTCGIAPQRVWVNVGDHGFVFGFSLHLIAVGSRSFL